MKTCKICKSSLPESEFYKANKAGNLRGECKTCKRKIETERTAARRKEFYEWKRTLCCERCGFLDFRALQFHHLSDKEENIARMVGQHSLESIKKEAAKCIVLCAQLSPN